MKHQFCLALNGRTISGYTPEGHYLCARKIRGDDNRPALSISNDMPEAGGGGGVTDGPEVAASDDDDGGDDDGEPAPRRSQAPTNAPALYDFHAVSHQTSFGRTRIYQLINDPVLKFPQPLKVGKSSRWLKTEVDSWIAKQAKSRITVAG